KDYLAALLSAKPGFYRVIVFIVTNVPFTQSDKKIGEEEAKAWTTRGANSLPENIKRQVFQSDFSCATLIYEFKKETADDKAEYVKSTLTGLQHLEKSTIFGNLSK